MQSNIVRKAFSRHSRYKNFKTLLDGSYAVPNILLKRLISNNRPFNTIVNFVPQQEAWIVERFGKFSRTCEPVLGQAGQYGQWILPPMTSIDVMFANCGDPDDPACTKPSHQNLHCLGINIVWPFLEQIKYVQVLKELVIEVPAQHAITADNVTLEMDGVLYLRITDPYKTSYGVEDAEFAVTQLAQTTMRSEIGKISLDVVFKGRESLNYLIVEAMNKASDSWGINCLRYEIRDIKLPEKVRLAMQMQVEAERKKRASILESEGMREAEINVAEGKKKSRVLNSEAHKSEKVNQAIGEAEAQIARAQAQAQSVRLVAHALSEKNGQNAVSVQIAEQYVKAFGNLAKTGNTVLLPTNTGDISSMVSQAMSIYTNLSSDRQRHASIESSEALEENITDSKPPSEHSNVGYDKNNDFTQIHFPELDTTRTSRRRTRTVVPEGMDSLTDLK